MTLTGVVQLAQQLRTESERSARAGWHRQAGFHERVDRGCTCAMHAEWHQIYELPRHEPGQSIHACSFQLNNFSADNSIVRSLVVSKNSSHIPV